MVQEQLHQNFAGVTGRADDGHFLRFHFTFLLQQKTFSPNKKPRRIEPAGLGNFQCD
jgi:hypothetical protein